MNPEYELRYWTEVISEEEARCKILPGGDWEQKTSEDLKRLEVLNIKKSDLVIDLGCGVGRLIEPVSKLCNTIFGVDVSDETLKYAVKRLQKVNNAIIVPMKSDIEIPIKNIKVDKAYSFIVLQHVERPKVFHLLKELNLCLKLNGEVLIQFPSMNNVNDYLNHLVNKPITGFTTPILCFYTKEELKLFFDNNGFEILSYGEDDKDFYVHARKIYEANWLAPSGVLTKWRMPNE